MKGIRRAKFSGHGRAERMAPTPARVETHPNAVLGRVVIPRVIRMGHCGSRESPVSYFFLGGTTASLNALASRNFTTVLAGILMASPV